MYRHSYSRVFPLVFELIVKAGHRVNVTSVELTEVNDRTDFTLITNNGQVTGIQFRVR